MGGHPYKYVVDWQPDITQCLHQLRQDVFARGDYLGADEAPATPEEALENAMEEGTRSILDIRKISDEPAICAAAGFDADDLEYYFGSATPTLAEIEATKRLWSDIDRGTARYAVAYEDGKPTKIVFMGYSFD